MAQSLGIIDIIWGGKKFNVDTKTASFQTGGMVNTPVTTGRKTTMSQMWSPMKVTASLTLDAGFSLAAFKALNGSEMQVKCDSGQSYTSASATLAKDVPVKGGAVANISCEWSGDELVEAGV